MTNKDTQQPSGSPADDRDDERPEQPPEPRDSTESGHAPIDETIRMDSEDSMPDVEEAPTGQTPPKDPFSTVIPPKDGKQSTSSDPDKTQRNTDVTVRVVPPKQAEPPSSVAKTDPPQAEPEVSADSVDQTLGNIEQTVAVNLPKDAPKHPTVYSGKSKTIQPVTNDTTVNTDNDSVLHRADVVETVNPRDLSEEDLKLWNSVVGDKTDEASELSPAIERTFSDKHFDRLRRCDVAELQSDADKSADYRLVRKLGEGGMGDVYTARQLSLDRLLALKRIKPLSGKKRAQLIKAGKLEIAEEDRRVQFLSEAIVTSDLDHPNIVPIHDVALSSSGELFYSMKRVVGQPWAERIKEQTREENIEILLKVCDAIGFAHGRSVVHRDIKPENIMLGDFGEVMVMDWGLALPTKHVTNPDSIYSTSSLGGTPAFMAPEMATGPLTSITPASDIYLLGATLFMIITGRAPHRGKNVTECLKAVRANEIREVAAEQRGELLDIALRAMATNPAKRFGSVREFQDAVREYVRHAQSVDLSCKLSEQATADLQHGTSEQNYEKLSMATFGFEKALDTWGDNEEARQGIAKSKLAHAEAAYAKEDYELGLSLLDENNEDHAPVIAKLQAERQGRRRRATLLSTLKYAAAAMLAIIIVGGGVSIWTINEKRTLAEKKKAEAEEQRRIAEAETVRANQEAERANEQTKIAEDKSEQLEIKRAELEIKKQEAEDNLEQAKVANAKATEEYKARQQADRKALLAAEQLAESERAKTVIEKQAKEDLAKEVVQKELARSEAVRERDRAEYEAYTSKISLAKNRLEQNQDGEGAKKILDEIRNTGGETWEWRWLWQQATQSDRPKETDSAIIDQDFDSRGQYGLIVLDNGRVQGAAVDTKLAIIRDVSEPIQIELSHVTSVAVAPGGKLGAVGTRGGQIHLVDLPLSQSVRRLSDKPREHTAEVSDLQFTENGLLVSASLDKTVRVWEYDSGSELTAAEACWHISPVGQIALHSGTNSLTIAAATSDASTGQVVLWDLKWPASDPQSVTVKRRGAFEDHRVPVSSVAVSHDGRLVASGDVSGQVLVWTPARAQRADHKGSIQRALDKIRGGADPSQKQSPATRPNPAPEPDPLLDDDPEHRFVSKDSFAGARQDRAHGGKVSAIRFSADGQFISTASDDYTVKIWETESRQLEKTLKGHGGWVVGAEFLGPRSDVVVSASDDATVRTWRPNRYKGAYVVHRLDDDSTNQTIRQGRAHKDEVWSARFSPDGTKVVTASHDHTAQITTIDSETLSFVDVIPLDEGENRFAINGQVLDEGTSYVAMSMQVDRQHNRLLIGSADATIRVWDLEHGTQLSQLKDTGLNTSFAISEDGRTLLTGSSTPDVKAKLWDLSRPGSEPRPLTGHAEAVTAFAVSPKSRYAFTGDRGGFGLIWDLKTLQSEPIDVISGYRINDAAFSPDGKHLLLVADDEQLTVINVSSGQRVQQFNHEGYVTRLAVSPNGPYAVTLSESLVEEGLQTRVTLWDWTSNEADGRLLDQVTSRRDQQSVTRRAADQRITSVGFDESGRRIVACRAAVGRTPAMLLVWNASQLEQSGQKQTLTSVTSSDSASMLASQVAAAYQLPAVLKTAEAIVPLDGSSLLTMNKNGAFKWDLGSNRLVKSYRAHSELTEASFSFDGKFVATCSRSVKIWDAESGGSLGKIELRKPLRSVAFAPKHALEQASYVLATGGEDGIVRLWKWDPGSQQMRESFQLKEDGVPEQDRPAIRRVLFPASSLDQKQNKSQLLLAVGDRGLATLWDLQTRKATRIDVADQPNLTCGALSADGRYVALGGDNRDVLIYELENLAAGPIHLEGHSGPVNDVTFLGATGSLRVATASADNTTRIWDPRIGADDSRKGRELVSLRRHQKAVTSVDRNATDDLLMTAGADGMLILWPAGQPNPADLDNPFANADESLVRRYLGR